MKVPKDEGRLKSASYTPLYLAPLGNRKWGYTLRKIFILRLKQILVERFAFGVSSHVRV